MEYIDMLRKARKNLPTKSAERFEILNPNVYVGRQTFIRNFLDIAKSLRRDPIHISKFLFKELAVPGEIRGSELILQGKILQSMVMKRIEDYTKEFVICKECGKPDTSIIKEDSLHFVKCEACGAKRSARKM